MVRPDRVSVGELIDLTVHEVVGEETVVHGSPNAWEVVAIEANGEGHTMSVPRKGAPLAVWDGTLVLRPVPRRGHS